MSKRDLTLDTLDAYVGSKDRLIYLVDPECDCDTRVILTPAEAVQLMEWLSEVTS
jgi:hypothetical protein